MPKIDFAVGSFLVGLSFTFVLIVLDKAEKLKGPILLVLLGVATVLMLPLVLSMSWVSGASPGMLKFSRGMLMVFVVGLAYAAIAAWISGPSLSETITEMPPPTPPPEPESPKFRVRVGQAFACFNEDEGGTFVLLTVEIRNDGAPSATQNWRGHYQSPTLDSPIGLWRVVKQPVEIPLPDQPKGILEFYNSDSIAEKTAQSPIIQGVPVSGRLPLWIPGDRLKEIRAGALIEIGVGDYQGHRYYGQYRSSGPTNLIVLPGEKVAPKRPGRPPIKMEPVSPTK